MKRLPGFVTLFVLLIAGCATGTATLEPELSGPVEGKAAIYIYRSDASPDTGVLVPNVRVNNASLGSLFRRGYLRVEVPPGAAEIALYPLDRGDDHTYWPTAHNSVVNLSVVAGETYFIELSINTMLFRFRPVPRERALVGLRGSQILN